MLFFRYMWRKGHCVTSHGKRTLSKIIWTITGTFMAEEGRNPSSAIHEGDGCVHTYISINYRRAGLYLCICERELWLERPNIQHCTGESWECTDCEVSRSAEISWLIHAPSLLPQSQVPAVRICFGCNSSTAYHLGSVAANWISYLLVTIAKIAEPKSFPAPPPASPSSVCHSAYL